MKVEGDSMIPTLRNGQVVFIVSAEEGISENDIILFRRKNVLILHRIIKKYAKRLLLKGDNEDEIDIIGYDKVIGKYSTISSEINGSDYVYKESFENFCVSMVFSKGVFVEYSIIEE